MSVICEITGVGIQFGHNVSHAKNRTKTTWAPNLHNKRIYSKKLGFIRMKISSRGLRTVDQHGGLDEYLTSTHSSRLTPSCLQLKKRIQSHNT